MNTRLRKYFLLFWLFAGLALQAAAGQSNVLLDVRVGPHKHFDRVVFEFSSQATGRVSVKSPQKIEVRFPQAEARSNFTLPPLPRGLTVLKGIDAFRENETDLVFEITLARDAVPSELSLSGKPWRLAVDLAPRVTETPTAKPEYIPGDLPIPTRFGDNTPEITDTLDPIRVHSVLAYLYQGRGDSQKAREEAKVYQQLTGKTLDLGPEVGEQTAQIEAKPHTGLPRRLKLPQIPRVPIPQVPQLLIFGLVFGVGIAGGFLLRSVLRSNRVPRVKEPKPPKPPREKKLKRTKDRTRELEQDLQVLEEAVAKEPVIKPKKAPEPPKPAPEPEPELVLDNESEMKESLMDRRVKRVLELSKQGATVSAIAEELQMGQDEVKLILDLNQQ
jgi:hypothetical protein